MALVVSVAALRRGERGASDEARAHACAAKARTDLCEGDIRDALHWAEIALAFDPGSAESLRLAGGARAALGDVRTALERFEAAAELAPTDAEAALSAGLAARQLARRVGDVSLVKAADTWFRTALERADAAVAHHPEAIAPRIVAAAAGIASRDYDGALARLEGVRPRSEGEREQIAVLRAAAEACARRPESALRALDEALAPGCSAAAAAARERLAALCDALHDALRERARRCLAAGRPEDAATLLADLVRERPGGAAGLAVFAQALHASGRGAESDGVRDALASRGTPRDADAAEWFSAHAMRASGDRRGALDRLESLATRLPSNAGVLAAVLACADDADEPARGLAAAEACAANAPQNPAIATLVGAARERAGDVDGAIRAYRSAVAVRAGDPSGYASSAPTADATANSGVAKAAAISAAGRSRRLAEDRLADLLLRVGRAEEALAVLIARDARRVAERCAAERRVDDDLRLAQSLLAVGRIADAERVFRAVAAADPACAAGHVGAARAAWLRGDPDAAHAALDDAFSADADSVDAWISLFAVGRDAAARHVADARLAAATVARPRSAALPFVAGVVAEGRGDFDGAVIHYRASLAIAPRSVPARNNLAWVLATALGRPQEARPLAESAFADAPTSPHVMDTVGWTRFLNDDSASAEPLLAGARRGMPRRAAVALRHARVLTSLGRTSEAREALDAASAADPAIRTDPEYRSVLSASNLVPAAAPCIGGASPESEVPR